MKYLRKFFSSADHPLKQEQIFRIQYPAYGSELEAAFKPQPIHKKVLMITHDPVLHSKQGQTLKQYFNWNDSQSLAQAYIEDVRWASYGYANYEVVEHIIVDGYPIKQDGFCYDEQSYLKAWEKRTFHDPDGVNYRKLVQEFQIIERVNNGEIDEVWLFGHPYGGYYESIMCGPDAFWCNAPPLSGTEHAKRRFVIMGFNFERGVGEMLEDLGHRAESMLFQVVEGLQNKSTNVWEKFLRIERDYPGRSEVGSVHFSPNSIRDYDWGNPTPVKSFCDNWYHFPDLSGESRWVCCSEWGNGDIRLHHLWWFRHMPHIRGESDGIQHNWWEYIIDPNQV